MPKISPIVDLNRAKLTVITEVIMAASDLYPLEEYRQITLALAHVTDFPQDWWARMENITILDWCEMLKHLGKGYV